MGCIVARLAPTLFVHYLFKVTPCASSLGRAHNSVASWGGQPANSSTRHAMCTSLWRVGCHSDRVQRVPARRAVLRPIEEHGRGYHTKTQKQCVGGGIQWKLELGDLFLSRLQYEDHTCSCSLSWPPIRWPDNHHASLSVHCLNKERCVRRQRKVYYFFSFFYGIQYGIRNG